MPISICHLITGLDTGGAERSLVNLVTAMDRAEFDNEVVTLLNPGQLTRSLAEAAIPVRSLGVNRHRPNPALLLSLIRYLRAKRPAILQTWLYHADFLGTLAALVARPEHLVWNVRCSDVSRAESMPRSTRHLARFLARFSRRPDAIIVNSQRGKNDHAEIGYHPKEWIHIPNGVDLGHFSPRHSERAMLRARIGLPANAIVIGFVARYHPMKDAKSFLRAASLFQQRHGSAKFVLCGDGLTSDNAELAELIRALNLGHCAVLLGRRADVELLYPTFDLLALCSLYGEGFPNVVAEAMACGVPCVATDVGDCVELIGHSGRIVPMRNPQALADAYGMLVETGLQELGSRARDRMVARYGLEQMVSRYQSLYRSIVADDCRSAVGSNKVRTAAPQTRD